MWGLSLPTLPIPPVPAQGRSSRCLFTSSTGRVDHRETGQETTVMEGAGQLSMFILLQQELNWRKCLIWDRDLRGGLVLFWPEKNEMVKTLVVMKVFCRRLPSVPTCSAPCIIMSSQGWCVRLLMRRVYQEAFQATGGHPCSQLSGLFWQLWLCMKKHFQAAYSLCVFEWKCCCGPGATRRRPTRSHFWIPFYFILLSKSKHTLFCY